MFLRRLITAGLLFIFATQSTGLASANSGTPTVRVQPLIAQIQSDLALIAHQFLGTYVGAVVSNTVPRYQLIHAPAPSPFPRPTPMPPADSIIHNLLTPARPTAVVGPGNLPATPELPISTDATSSSPAAATSLQASHRTRTRSLAASLTAASTVDSSQSATTGTVPWWTFKQTDVPGVGRSLVNTFNGNLVVQSVDFDVAERNLDFQFRRTYNSLSTHDYSNTDGSVPSNYGNGWTNNFDVHIATNSSGGVSIYDDTGARYDYTSTTGNCLAAPAGLHDKLCLVTNPQGVQSYQWTKTSGEVYQFFLPTTGDAYAGRLNKIWARIHNDWISLAYAWDNNDSSSAANLNTITVSHSNGQSMVLQFQNWSGNRELTSITLPDTTKSITYRYDASGNLTDVCTLGNNSTDLNSQDNACNWATPHIHYQYHYTAGTHTMDWINSPNWVMNNYQHLGMYQKYYYDAQGRLNQLTDTGNINPSISDGVTPVGGLQTGYVTSPIQYYVANYSGYGVVDAGSQTQAVTFSDSDGHAAIWTEDINGRIVTTQQWAGSYYLLTSDVWDANNNLIETTDPRSETTDYAYDANGNVIAVAGPQVSTDKGTFRPTSLYSYDIYNGINHNNLRAYCDPEQVGTSGYDWANRPQSDTLCSATSGHRYYTWDYSDVNEPYGRLSQSHLANGYSQIYGYDTTVQSGDRSLVTDITGDCITQLDGTTRCPHQHFSYGAKGNLISYSKGDSLGTWTASYDSLNRLLTAKDPTGATGYRYYYDNGQVKEADSAYQNAHAAGTTYSYDADGNAIETDASKGGAYSSTGFPALNVSAKTSRYFDADDRLIEVVQPHDTTDLYTTPWVTRYIYDISGQGGTASLSFHSQNVTAYGNLYKTEEYLPANPFVQSSPGATVTPTQFQELKAESFDPLNRVTSRMQMVYNGSTYSPSDNVSVETEKFGGLDAGNQDAPGLLTSSCNAMNVCKSFGYDASGRVDLVKYNDGTTSQKAYTYDADGRMLTESDDHATDTYTYDGEGRLITSQEAYSTGESPSLTSPALLTYAYYGDGARASVSVNSAALKQDNLFAYSYRSDGVPQWQQINDTGNAKVGTTVITMSHDDAGRLLARTESGPGANATPVTISYDPTTGVATSKTFPGGSLQNVQYDASGAPLGYQATANGTSSTDTYKYSSRGELISASGAAVSTAFANGVPVPKGGNAPSYTLIDALMGAVVATGSIPIGSGTTGASNSSDLTFDANGRLTSESTSGTDSNGEPLAGTTSTRQYDAENHVTMETYEGPASQLNQSLTYGVASYLWGPSGHPIAVGSGYSTTSASPAVQSSTLHWAGNDLFFTTNSSGTLEDIKVGSMGDITADNGLVFYDRAFDSDVSFCHSSSGASGTGAADPYSTYVSYKIGSTPSNPCGTLASHPTTDMWAGSPSTHAVSAGVGNGNILAIPHGDGISDGYNTIQGARDYDSSSGFWVSPDDYWGNVFDPISQKQYLWNRGNGLEFGDTNGHDPDGLPSNQEMAGGTLGATLGAYALAFAAVIVVGAVVAVAAPELLAVAAVEVTIDIAIDTGAGTALELGEATSGTWLPPVLANTARIGGLVGGVVGGDLGEKVGATFNDAHDSASMDKAIVDLINDTPGDPTYGEIVWSSGIVVHKNSIANDRVNGLKDADSSLMLQAIYGSGGVPAFCPDCNNEYPGQPHPMLRPNEIPTER